MPNAIRRPSQALVIGAFAIVYVVWGSTYLAIRYAIETLPPFLLGGVRFFLAGLLLSAWALVTGAERPTKTNWKAASIVGILFFPCANGIVVWAETRIGSGMAALLVAIEPFWVVLVLALLARKWPRPAVLGGVVLGFAGLIILIGPNAVAGNRSIDLVAAGALIAASCSWALGSVYARSAPLPRAPLLAAGLEMLVGGFVLIIVGLLGGELRGFELAAVSIRSIAGFVYLLLFGSIVAFTAYSWLVGVVAPARVATYAYVNPVIAVFLGWLVAGEAITGRVAVAAAVIVGAVALVVIGQSPDVQQDTGSRDSLGGETSAESLSEARGSEDEFAGASR
jgi:drug/metabolite transporter (DMT)-like permease